MMEYQSKELNYNPTEQLSSSAFHFVEKYGFFLAQVFKFA